MPTPPDDRGLHELDLDDDDERERMFEERWARGSLIGVKTSADSPIVMILAGAGGISTTSRIAQELVKQAGDAFSAVPFLVGELQDCSDQELAIWATTDSPAGVALQRWETGEMDPRFPIVDFGQECVRGFEIADTTGREFAKWTFAEFADTNWRRRGHPFQALDPELLDTERVSLAPEWVESLRP